MGKTDPFIQFYPTGFTQWVKLTMPTLPLARCIVKCDPLYPTSAVKTYSDIIQRWLQAGEASFDTRCHNAEDKQTDSTGKAPAPHTKLHVRASAASHIDLMIYSYY